MSEVIISTPAYLPEGAKYFDGRYIDVMPVLLQEGLVPISPAGVMDLRNQHPTSDENSPWRTWFDTDAGFAIDGKKVHLFSHSKQLRAVTPDTKLTRYGITLKGTKGSNSFSRKDLKLEADLTEKEALAHPLWLALADGDRKRLESYVQNAFQLGKDKFQYDKNMGFYLPDDRQPILRAVVLYGLDGGAGAYGGRDLDDNVARLVGARQSAKASLEKRLR